MIVTSTALRRYPTLAAAFADACARHPDRVAIRDRGRSTTYRDLARRVEKIATRLRDRQAGGGVVAVALEPGLDAVCAVLAALAAGAAYLPLDPSMPDAYLAGQLADTRPRMVITRAGAAGRFGTTAVDVDALTAADEPEPSSGAETVPGDPAYVIFTSGSTGRPKGVVVSHAAILHSTAARVDAYGIPGRVALLHSPAVDVHTGVLFWALLTGGTLVIGAGLRDVPATVALLDQEQVTDLVYLASLYPAFLEYAALRPPRALRRVMIGSDRWSEAVIDRHAGLLPHVWLHNEYGPTEAAVWTSQACVWDGAARRRAPLTIGRPVRGTGFRVLNEHRHPTAVGEPGELFITGAQLADGYWGQPALTADRFVTLADGVRAYRTGDLVELTASGDVAFAGRVDRQVKVGGTRIEPAHVEAVLMAHPTVGVAHVTAPAGALIAYLTARRPGRVVDIDDVSGHAAAHLPPGMVPSVWMVVDDLPRAAGGKIDESALPAPTHREHEPVAPADGLEAEIAAVVGEVLHTPAPPVTTPLTDIGASSLALMQVAARIARDHRVLLPFAALLTDPTVRAITALVRSGQLSDRPPLRTARHDPAGAPLSAQQRQIWFLNALQPDSLAYNTQCSLHLDGALDVDALRRALSHVVARHEILRTTFHARDDEPVQVVHDPWPVALTAVDLTNLPESARGAALQRLLAEQTAITFDTSRLPLVRWRLYRTATDEWTLFQVEHHFVHDGWSANLLLAEIRDAYAAYARGTEPDLPPLAVQYRDFAAWQRTWMGTADHAGQRRYWRQHLHGVTAHGVSFAADGPRPPQQSFAGRCLRVHVPADTVDALDTVGRQHGITRFAVFLTAFALLVRQHTGEDDITIGSALANRRHPEAANLLGMFVNALPLRLRVDASTVAQVARHTMAVLAGAQDNQEFPLVEIIKDLGLPRDPGRNPLFQLMFAFHDTPRPTFDAAGITGRLRIDHNGSAKNDLNVVCVPQPATTAGTAGIDILWEYNRDLFRADTAQHLLDSYTRLLAALADPSRWDQPTTFDVLDPAGADQVLGLAHGAPVAAAHTTLHAGVDAQIAATPSAVAVEHGDRQLTYADLGRAAAAISGQLQEAGVKGGRVAVLCGPGPDHVAACLAVLRRGGAYVCLDPAEPAARLAQLLTDLEPDAVICTADTANRPGVAAGGPVIVAAPDIPTRTGLSSGAVAGDDPAYLVYTSGSTGAPKAVVATHRNAVTAVTARTAHLGAGPDGETPVRTLVSLPLQFDVATSMIFWTLWTGGTLVFPDHADVRDPDQVRALIDTHRVTHVNFVASFYQQFLATAPPGWTSTLRTVAVGGEPCPTALVRAHALRLPEAALDNEYGPTEATVWCAASRVHDPGRRSDPDRVTVGRPLANYVLYVVDEQLRPRPIGAGGEICVAGRAVTAGYLNRPDLTAARFVTPPAGPLAGVRLYRTGDEGRLRADGMFEVFGRLDEQVKIRGYRVELGEIRHCLQTHPQVDAAHITVDAVGPGGRVVAYAAARHAPAELAETLRAWAAQRLPAYMVPATVVVLDALPLTATGKVDHAALPRPHPASDTTTPAADAVEPVEAALVAVWRQVLGHDRVGVDDDWFAAGGDSLTAIRATAALRERGLPVDVGQFLAAGTVRRLAAQLPTATSGDSPARAGGTLVPLTAIQGWFFAQDFAQPHHFNQARLLSLPPNVSVTALRAALTAVIGRHEAFRTRFTHQEGWHARLDDTPPAIDLIDHTVPPGAAGPDPRVLDGLHRRLDLEKGPLWATALFTDPVAGRRWLAVVAHHLIVDAVSWDNLARDLNRAYRHPDLPLPPAPGIPPPRPVPQGPEADFWADLAAADKPRLHGAVERRSPYAGLGHHDADLSPHATAYLRDLARSGRATIPATLLAALRAALTPLTHGDGLYTFVEGHGREQLRGADETVGWLTSLYPVLLTDPAGGHGRHLPAAAASISGHLASIPAAGTGFGVARYLHPTSPLGRQLAAADLPEITFNYLGDRGSADGDPIRVLTDPAGDAIGPDNSLPTALHVTAAGDGPVLRLRFTYDHGFFRTGAVDAACRRMVADLERTARLEPLTPRPAGQPHVLVHPVDGQVHWYEPLAHALHPDWDSYGLRADTTDRTDIPAMAARYVERLRDVQPDGPYLLTGWSFGAAVAFDMARILEARGAVVRLFLLDPPPRPVEGTAALAGHLSALLPGRPPEQISDAVAASATQSGQAARLAAALDVDDRDLFIVERLRALVAHHQALARWTPAGTVDNVHLVQPATSAAPHGWWQAAGRTVRHIVVPGDHRSMLRGAALDRLTALYRELDEPPA